LKPCKDISKKGDMAYVSCVFGIYRGGVVFSTLHGALYVPNSDYLNVCEQAKQNMGWKGL